MNKLLDSDDDGLLIKINSFDDATKDNCYKNFIHNIDFLVGNKWFKWLRMCVNKQARAFQEIRTNCVNMKK